MAGLFKSKLDRQHRFCSSNLSAYVDGALATGDKQKVEQHLHECEVCRQDLLALRQTRALLRRAPMRPVPRSFVLPASVQPEQSRYRRWTATYSFMKLATTAVTLVLILLLSGDMLLSTGIRPIADQSRPAREAAAPAVAPAPMVSRVEPTQAAGQAESLPQQPPAAPQGAGEGNAPPPNQVLGVEAAPTGEGQALGAEQPAEQQKDLGAQGQDAEQNTMATSAPAAPMMAPKRAAASPAETSAQQSAPAETPMGLGGGPAAAQAAETLAEATSTSIPTAEPTAAPLPTEAPPTLAHTRTSAPLAMRSEGSSATQEAPAAAETMPEQVSPVYELWRTLRLLWMAALGLLLILLGALLWLSTKRSV